MSDTEEVFASREHLERIVAEALSEDPMGLSMAEHVVEALVGSVAVMPADRWDEDCHACEQRIGDHTVDGRCPWVASLHPALRVEGARIVAADA